MTTEEASFAFDGLYQFMMNIPAALGAETHSHNIERRVPAVMVPVPRRRLQGRARTPSTNTCRQHPRIALGSGSNRLVSVHITGTKADNGGSHDAASSCTTISTTTFVRLTRCVPSRRFCPVTTFTPQHCLYRPDSRYMVASIAFGYIQRSYNFRQDR